MSLTQRCTSSQYHANIPVESIPHHTTQNEFKSKINSSTSLTANENWKLEMRRMSMSKLQSLSKSWRQKQHEQPLGIPGHKRPSLPHRRWNCEPNRCLSRKCSSSKLRLVPGQRESDLEVDQGWHLWDVMKYKWDKTLSFRLRVSKQQFPLDSRQMCFTEVHFQPISCQYPSRKHATSDHTKWVQVKNQFTHFTHSQQKLETGNAKDDHEQTTKPFKKLATKTPWTATWNPGTQKAFTPSSPMELSSRSMLVAETFVLKASASAWPKGKRCGSRSKLTSVRPHEIQMRQNSQFPTPSVQTAIPTGFRANVFDTEMHFQPISCQYPSRKHTTSYHTECVQVKKKFTHFTHSRLNLKIWKCEGWEWANYKAFQEAGDKDTMNSHLESRDTKGLHPLIADGIQTQADACHGSVRLQSFSQCLAEGKAMWK